MNLTQRGIFLFSEGMSAGELAAAAQHIERLGYGAVWFPEAVGREPVLAASWVLANTSKLIAATGIVNIYSRDPMACAMMQQTLTEQSRGRFLLGLGVSHTLFVNLRGHDYGKPLATMRTYVDNIAASHKMIAIKTNLAVEGMSEQPLSRNDDGTLVAEVGEMPIILAALGPKMTALSGQIAQGSHPANTTPEHTAAARAIFLRQTLDGFAFDVEVLMLARALGMRVDVLPVRWLNSPDSSVHIVRDSWRMFRDLLRVRARVRRTLRRQPASTRQ